MAKAQRKIGSDIDRFVMLCDIVTGERIRRVADKMRVSYSKFIADIVLSKLDELEARLEE